MKKIADFAFIVHSRDSSDLARKFYWLKFLPTSFVNFICFNLPPFVVSKITGLKSVTNENLSGIVIGIPMTARQLLEHKDAGLRRIISSVRLAKKKGAKFVGLGAMTSSLSRGGRDVIDNISEVYVTTGRTYTIKNITDYVEWCVSKFNLNRRTVNIAVVGAAGGIGSGVAISLAKNGFKNFKLIDLERKLTHLKKHIEVLLNHSDDLIIDVSHQISSVISSDIIIAATSAPEVIIKSVDVSPGTIIINDAQPSDVSPDIINNRPDVLVVEGGVVRSENIDCHFNFGLSSKKDIFSCLAETLWLAHNDIKEHHSIGEFDQKLLNKMREDSQKLGFSISKLQNTKGYISENYIDSFAKIIATRN